MSEPNGAPAEPADADVMAAVAAAIAAQPDPTPEQAPEAPSEPEPAAEPEPAPEAPSSDLYSDAALKTPEGIKAAAADLKRREREAIERQKKLDKGDIKFKKRDKEWERKRDEEVAKLAEDRATARALRAHLGLLRTGSATQILETLGLLTGKSGRKVWEEMGQAALRDGRAPAESPIVEELRAELAGLKEALAGKAKADENAAAEREKSFVRQRKGEIIQAASDATKYPEIAAYAAKGRGKEILSYVMDLKRASVTDSDGEQIPGATPLDDASCLAKIEAEIRAIKGRPTDGAPNGPGTVQGTGQSPGESQSRSTPQSLSPSNTRTRSVPREMTEQERLDELRRNPDYIFGLFGH